MAGRPKSRAIISAQLDAMRELSAWREEKAALIDALPDISAEDRAELHKMLMSTWGRKADAAMKTARRRGKRTQAQMRADLDDERRGEDTL